MGRDFIPYEEALALKEMGFKEECLGMYREGSLELHKHTGGYYSNSWINKFVEPTIAAAPTFSQAFRWFRECGLYGGPLHIFGGSRYFIEDKNKNYHNDKTFKTPIEAEIACLRELIKIVKENK